MPLLRLYFEPTWPASIDWSSPRRLLLTTIAAQLRNAYPAIGHVAVEVVSGKKTLLTGAIDVPGKIAMKLLLREQLGFSILQVGWPGHLESAAEVKKHLSERSGNPQRLSIATWEIPESTAERLFRYHEELAKELPKLFYGNGPRPRRKEGSGCSAFGASFLELAGLLTPELEKEWIIPVRIPLSLMAGHGRDRVPIWKILFSPSASRWARADEPHMDFKIFSPDKMYLWACRLAATSPDSGLPHGLQGIPAARFEATHVRTPNEPIFLSESRLVPHGELTVVRSDRAFAPDGSFSLHP